MNNKILRYLSGFIILAVIIASFYFSKIMLLIISALLIIAAMFEYRNMFKQKKIYPHVILPELIGIICASIFIFEPEISDHNFITPILITGIIFSFIITVITNKKPYILTSLSTISAFLFIICGLYIIKLTYYFEHISSFYLITVYFAAILCGDYAASKVGQFFKNIPLSYEISPDKTIAGSIANLIISCLICLLFNLLLNFSIMQCLISGIIISVFSQFGDLTVSTFKRDLGLKHSGSLFYDYGGILDRMDAFVFSAPAIYYYLFIITIM